MSIASPRSDILEALDIVGYFAHQLAFCQLLLDTAAESGLVRLGERIGFHVAIDAELREDPFRHRTSDALDRRESDLDSFIARKDDTRDTNHFMS